MESPSDHYYMCERSLDESFTELVPSQAIHRCMAYIWERLHLRARLFLLEGESLILKDFVGEYRCPPEIGLKVHPKSIVWQIFREGKPVNLAETSAREERPHTLPEPVLIKAVIPLRVEESLPADFGEALGVLVVDAGDSLGPIEDRDFHYLQILGMLISQILQGSILLARIQKIQKEREKMAGEIAHIVRNRLIVIGGFARRLRKALMEPKLKKWAEIILQEAEKGERSMKQWTNAGCRERMSNKTNTK